MYIAVSLISPFPDTEFPKERSVLQTLWDDRDSHTNLHPVKYDGHRRAALSDEIHLISSRVGIAPLKKRSRSERPFIMSEIGQNSVDASAIIGA